jgi:hypothetical protein
MKEKDIENYKEQIFSIVKTIVEENFPDELILFELNWHNLWKNLCERDGTDLKNWEYKELKETEALYFPTLSRTEKRRYVSLSKTIRSVVDELLINNEKVSLEELATKTKIYGKEHGTPGFVFQRITELLYEINKSSTSDPSIDDVLDKILSSQKELEKSTSEAKMGESQSKLSPQEEKKEYKIYSHEYQENPQPASKETVLGFDNMEINERNNRFEIYFNNADGKIFVRGQLKSFKENVGGEKEQKLLYLFLANVGNFVEFSQIKEIIFHNKETISYAVIHQLKKRICEFTEGVITPFIEMKKSGTTSTKGYLINEKDLNGNLLKYCMISRSRERLREEKEQKTTPPIESKVKQPPSPLITHEQEEEITFLFKQIETSRVENREYKYIMYTEQDVKEDIETTMKCGRKLTEEWYSELQNFYPRLAEQILYILDFASEIFYFNGKQLPTSTDPKAEYNYYKALFIILLSPKGTQITFEDLYRNVTGVYDEEKARITTQHWFTVLKNRLGVKKKDLNRLFKSWKREGYKVEKEEESKFLLILETGMVQKIMKFSKS